MSQSIDGVVEPIAISLMNGRYLLFDIDVITYLRRTHHIIGSMIGGIPQLPQQNVFLGLPLDLLPEEVKWLVDRGIAYIFDDHTSQRKRHSTLQGEDRKKYLESLRSQGLQVVKIKESAQKQRSKTALAKNAMMRAQRQSDSQDNSIEEERSDTPDLESADTSLECGSESGESLFSSDPSPSPKQSNVLKPYPITPTTSHHSKPPDGPSLPTPLVSSSYPLFSHLHSKNYYIMPGLRFGGDYNVYVGDPLRYHSHFIATGYEWDQEISMFDVIGGGRLGTAVKKGFMLGGENPGSKADGDKVRTFCVEWAGM